MARRSVGCFAVLLSVAVLIKNAWVAEDAFIILRVVEQLWAGNGPVFNAAERVQVYTSPLWFLVLAASRALTSDPFLLVLGTSVALWLATVAVLRSILRDRVLLATGLLVMLMSASFFDFTSSGLENPLAYLILLSTLAAYLELHRCSEKSSGESAERRGDSAARRDAKVSIDRGLKRLLVCVGLILCVRHDLSTLLALPVLFTMIRCRRAIPVRRWIVLLGWGAAPLVAWTVFSVVYYGFPFPNTAYAKITTGVPRFDLIAQGSKYLLDAVRYDPVTPAIIGLALLACGLRRSAVPTRALGAGIATNMGYVVWVGGDFMRGRFLSFSFLVALVLCLVVLREASRPVRRAAVALVGGLVLCSIVLAGARVPLTHPPRAVPIGFNSGITDERAYFFRTHRVLNNVVYRASDLERRPIETHRYAVDGRNFRDSDKQVAIADNVGTFAYYAGLDQHIVDVLALTDPLLARLPALQPWRIGHFERRLPSGYLAGLLSDSNQIADSRIRELNRDLRLVTRSSLTSTERWKAILRLNRGAASHEITSYESRDPRKDPAVFLEQMPSSRRDLRGPATN